MTRAEQAAVLADRIARLAVEGDAEVLRDAPAELAELVAWVVSELEVVQ